MKICRPYIIEENRKFSCKWFLGNKVIKWNYMILITKKIKFKMKGQVSAGCVQC